MRALILVDSNSASNNDSPGASYTRTTANCCYSMGIKVSYLRFLSAGDGATLNPTVAELAAIITDIGADMVILPTLNSVNRTAWGDYQDAVATFGVPMFALNASDANRNYSPGLASTSAFYPGDTTTDAFPATFVRTGGATHSYQKRFVLKTDLVAPAAVYPLIQGTGADITAVSAFKYTPDGTNFVYTHNIGAGSYHNLLHFLIQEAVYDGLLDPPPVKAPVFLTIDHINGGGDTNVDGTVGQPQIISQIGGILRAANAVCYASWERAKFAAMTATQKANLLEYNDVLKYVASHDHQTQHLTQNTTANDAIANQRSKSAVNGIDFSYQTTKSNIESTGCEVETSLMHFAQNSVGTNFYDLAQRSTDISADPAGATAMAGYGAKICRIATDYLNRYSYPPAVARDWIWQYKPMKYRGIILIPSTDGGENWTRGLAADSAATIKEKNYKAFVNNIYSITNTQIVYMHEIDFEDATLTSTTPLLSDGASNLSRGILMYQLGAAYQAACPDTFKWGANVDDYVS